VSDIVKPCANEGFDEDALTRLKKLVIATVRIGGGTKTIIDVIYNDQNEVL